MELTVNNASDYQHIYKPILTQNQATIVLAWIHIWSNLNTWPNSWDVANSAYNFLL